MKISFMSHKKIQTFTHSNTKHRYLREENINTPSSILRGKFERLALPLNFRQMHLCDIPYLRDGNADDSNDSSKVDKRKQEVTSRWRLVLQSDFWWCSFSTHSSSNRQFPRQEHCTRCTRKFCAHALEESGGDFGAKHTQRRSTSVVPEWTV